MRWLRSLFYSDDPDVKIADGLSEFDAGIGEELLRNRGIIAMKKNMSAYYDRLWRPHVPWDRQFALWVKQSDADAAREILLLALDERQLVEGDRDE
jgi:hypothetical protein